MRGQPRRGRHTSLDSIASGLRPLAVPIRELALAQDNARQHSERDLPILMESLRRFGQRKPVVAKREYRGQANVAVAGNGTLAAARRLGWTQVAVAWFEGTDDEARQYALVDNRSAELSEWNFEALSAQLADLHAADVDLPALLGWDEETLSPLLASAWHAPDAEPLPDENAAAERTSTLVVTASQREVITQAVARVRRHGGASLSDGRCLELLCADWLSGPYPDAD
jgi:ParB-like chromosome segregation protein Spo0J